LYKVAQRQYREADRALVGAGQYALRLEFARHKVTIDQWQLMTDAERSRLRKRCFCIVYCVNVSDGSLTVKLPSGRRQEVKPATLITCTRC
jgi:hypothetical protein